MGMPNRRECSVVDIRLGDNTYQIDTAKLPYFGAFCSFQQLSGRDRIHNPIPYIDDIIYGIENGYRHFFRRMPPDVEAYRLLCDTLDFLGVDVLGGKNLREIYVELKRWKKSRTPIWKEPREPNLSESRNAAFLLVYLFLIGDLDVSGHAGRVSNFAFQVVRQVQINDSVFDSPTRIVVKQAFLERFDPTFSQQFDLGIETG
ncbi:geranylgeranyl pyrophosphate synthetase [Colletotrichum camelliae]|nr:geranylgeranyl pyrophosphate synthetase [Colletotrichum camelliae]